MKYIRLLNENTFVFNYFKKLENSNGRKYNQPHQYWKTTNSWSI